MTKTQINKQEEFLRLIENNQIVIQQIGTDLVDIEKRIKGIYLWIHKLNQQQSELEIRLYKLKLTTAEKESEIKLEDIKI